MASTSVPLLLVLTGLALDFAAGQLCRNNFTSFVFERFDCFTDRHLKCTGGCTCTAEGQVNLTSYDTKSWGRLMYSPGIRLMDPVSSRVASFSTNFTFSMKGEYSRPGEGLAFVMQGNPEFQGHSGGFLGLYNSNGKAGTPTMAVEFDTYRDWFYGFFRYNDINNNHVGVDIDSINSKLQVDAGVFGIELAKERTVTAWIDYIPATEDSDGNLQVRISTDTTRPHLAILSYDVDLSKHISEMMYMGFSATTGDRCVSYHNILNWSFESWGLVPLSPPPILPPPPSVLPPIPLPPEPPAPSPCPVPPPPPPSPAPSPLTPSPSPSEFSPPAPAPSSSASPPSESPTAVPPPPSLSPPAPSPVIPPVPAPSPLPDSTAPVLPPPAPIPPIPDVPAPSPSLSPPPAISPSSSPASEPSLAPQSTPTPSAGPSPSSSVSPPAPASSPTPSVAPSPSSYVSPPAPTPTPSPAPSPSSYVSPPAPSSTPATSPSSYVPPPSPDSPSLPPAPDSHSTPVPSPGQSPSSASPPEDSPPSKLPPTYPPADPPSSSGPPTLTPGPSPSLPPSPEPALPPSPTPAPPPTPLPGQADATRPMSASIAGFALLLAAYVIVVWNKVQSELRDARHGHGEDGFFVDKP